MKSVTLFAICLVAFAATVVVSHKVLWLKHPQSEIVFGPDLDSSARINGTQLDGLLGLLAEVKSMKKEIAALKQANDLGAAQKANQSTAFIGEIRGFATEDAVPDDWIVCDGSAVPRDIFTGLWAKIGNTWGIGDGKTTFNIPNLTAAILAGTDRDGGVGRSNGFTVDLVDDFKSINVITNTETTSVLEAFQESSSNELYHAAWCNERPATFSNYASWKKLCTAVVTGVSALPVSIPLPKHVFVLFAIFPGVPCVEVPGPDGRTCGHHYWSGTGSCPLLVASGYDCSCSPCNI